MSRPGTVRLYLLGRGSGGASFLVPPPFTKASSSTGTIVMGRHGASTMPGVSPRVHTVERAPHDARRLHGDARALRRPRDDRARQALGNTELNRTRLLYH